MKGLVGTLTKWKIARFSLIAGAILLMMLSSNIPQGITDQQAAPFPLGKVRAIAFRTGDREVYPDQKVWLTLHGGYGTHDNNIIVTSGLNNVPLGTYVYLQGRDKDDHDVKITAWSWRATGPRGVQVNIENPTSQYPRFMASDEGRYEVSVTVIKEDGSSANSNLTAYAGRYIGAEQCAMCHNGSIMPDTVTKWRETGHATKFEDTFASYSATSDYCIGCHTTGYNETDRAGGFDDAARLAGWSPDKGSVVEWMLKQGMTLDSVRYSPMSKFMNVQCESCHGPGSIHEGVMMRVHTGGIFSPGVCSQCHPQEVQWRFSGHANTGAKNMEMAGNAGCVACHTGQGFVQVKIRGKAPVFPDAATAENPATLAEPGLQPPVACATCHDPHAFNEPFAGRYGPASLQLRMHGEVAMPTGVTKDAKESAVCVSCHANRRDPAYKADYQAGKKTRGPHGNPQADVFYGITAAAFDFGKGDYTNSYHDLFVQEACIQCHMAANPVVAPGPDGQVGTRDDVKALSAGGHSWNLVGEFEGKPVENVGACTGCHAGLTTLNRPARGDYDGDGAVEGIQSEVEGLLNVLAAELPKDAQGNVLSYPIRADNTTELQRMALWNYWLITNDGSRGVHNAGFAVQVLQRSYQELTGHPVPGATIR
ncbi:MAG: hypothetical protein HY314_09510 [Acidobacteria bacterium]|nr:hypothetical protein [Acidobacteriota bacterium]